MKLPEGVVLDSKRIENLTSVFPLQYLSMFEQLSKYKKWNVYYWLLYSNVLKNAFFSSLNQNTSSVYDAAEIKKQEQQEAIKKLYP